MMIKFWTVQCRCSITIKIRLPVSSSRSRLRRVCSSLRRASTTWWTNTCSKQRAIIAFCTTIREFSSKKWTRMPSLSSLAVILVLLHPLSTEETSCSCSIQTITTWIRILDSNFSHQASCSTMAMWMPIKWLGSRFSRSCFCSSLIAIAYCSNHSTTIKWITIATRPLL